MMGTRSNEPAEDNVSGFGGKNGNQPAGENYSMQTTRKTRAIDNIQNTGLDEVLGGKTVVPVGSEVGNRPQRNSNRRKPWLEALTGFAADVSVVGLRYVASPSASAFRRSVWALLVVVGAAASTYHIQDRIRYYAEYPVNVIIRVKHEQEMRFPTVTICNENMVSATRARELGKWQFGSYMVNGVRTFSFRIQS